MYIQIDLQGLAELLTPYQFKNNWHAYSLSRRWKHICFLTTHLMGAEVSPSSHHCFGGLMYMHHSSQLKPWPEFS